MATEWTHVQGWSLLVAQKRVSEICSGESVDGSSEDTIEKEAHTLEELGPLSSPVIASSKPKLPKAEDARKEGTPVSPVVSQTAPSLKHPTGLRHSRETTDIEMKGARKKDVKTITSAEPHFNVKAEEAGTTLGGSKKRKPKRVSEICSGESLDCSSEDTIEMEAHTLEELGPLSSPVIASSKPKLPKAEDARKEGTPVSPVGMEIKNVFNEPFC
ncbi:uncharacterized protein [Marmota flaviventris]|uniref:uncharacterized protein n=1 Tax=Marmota flaviventris TaxID=93162 RepID=UPI003A8BE260